MLVLCRIGSAQTCCTGGNPVGNIFDQSTLSKGEVKLSLTYENNSIDDIITRRDRSTSQSLKRNVFSINSQVEVGISEKWSFGVLLPYIQKRESTSAQSLTNRGLGDIVPMVTYRDTLSLGWNYAISVGTTIPTGSRQVLFGGFELQPSLQVGTGSIDKLAILGVNGRPFVNTAFRVALVAMYKRNGQGTNLGPHRKFQFGSEFLGILSVGTQVVMVRYLMDLSGGFETRYASMNTIEQFVDPNSGGRWHNLSATIGMNLDEKKKLFVGLDKPVAQKLNGLQLSTDLRWRTGLVTKF